MFKKLKKVMKNPKSILIYLLEKKVSRCLRDKQFLKIKYRLIMQKKLDLDNPITFNEKLQWLKLYDRKTIYTNMVDKYEVKNYVSNIIGKEYIIPTLGIWEKFEDIDFEKLPNQFVIKCTHDSGGIIICKDKSKLNIKNACFKIKRCMKRNYYYVHREWPYKNIKPRIIIEKYMVDESGIELKDYKFFCFSGEPKLLFIATDRPDNTKFNFYDMEFKKLPFMQHYNNFDKKIEKPVGFDTMVELAKKLSKDIPHVRVDFYDINGKVYFGELTFFHFSGFERFEPEEYDKILGDMLELPKQKLEEKNEK